MSIIGDHWEEVLEAQIKNYAAARKRSFEEGFLAGIAAVKEALEIDLREHEQAWGIASTDTRCDYVHELEVEIPDV